MKNLIYKIKFFSYEIAFNKMKILFNCKNNFLKISQIFKKTLNGYAIV